MNLGEFLNEMLISFSRWNFSVFLLFEERIRTRQNRCRRRSICRYRCQCRQRHHYSRRRKQNIIACEKANNSNNI